VSKGESLRDTSLTLSAMGADCVIVRHPASGSAHRIAAWADRDQETTGTHTSVVNAGDGTHEHPTQALLDAFTLWRHLGPRNGGTLDGMRVAIVGDVLHSRVARSLIHGLTTMQVPRVRVIAPRTLLPTKVESLGVAVFNDMREGLSGCDVIVMLRLQNERMKGALLPSAGEYFKHYGLTGDKLALARPDAIVMHPGPMNRGVEIESPVADGARSVILPQVTFGIAVRMAVLSIVSAN
jgi:aspartate carbamoyltransferase catalytic subunit